MEGERGREGESFCLSGEGAAARTEAQVEGWGLKGGCGGNICSALMRGEAAAAARCCEQRGGGAPASKGSWAAPPAPAVGGWAVGFPGLPLKGRRSDPPLSKWFQILSESPKVL